MKLSGFASFLLVCIVGFICAQEQWPLHNDGINSVVEWDHYSYIVNGQRLYIWSGEMHYWRAPVPEMWIDILEKIKAAGFNTVSFYGNWGYHSAKDGVLDFESGAHNFTKLFDLAKQVGLYIFFRPGPYVNAEATAGGFPGWLTTGAYGALRNNDTRYTEAWTPYFTKMSEIVAQHQVSNGGNVLIYQIENEYGDQWDNVAEKIPDPPAISYMELLESCARNAGINVPLTHNNPNMNTKSWSKDYGAGVGGDVDIYGLDSYPSCWSCNVAECASTNGPYVDFQVSEYYANFQQVSPTQPSFLAEFQGGSYNPWGGPQGGCINTTGPDWVNVYYRHNIAQKVTAMNIYMLFGGTRGLPMPTVATSYDYSAPISESRVIGDKYQETKIFAQFLRVARDLIKVDLIGNGTEYTSTTAIFTSELRNPNTNAAFYVTIHSSSPSTDLTPFQLYVSTSAGNLTIPQQAENLVLNGRESKIIVTDFGVGNEKLIYSTAEIFTVSTQDNLPLVFLWLPAGESGEFLLSGVNSSTVLSSDGCSNVKSTKSNKGVLVSYTQSVGSCAINFNNGYRFVLIDRSTAYATWVPSTSTDPYTPENSTVVVQGPYLVRSVSMAHETIDLTGDWSNTTDLEVFAPSSIAHVRFNGDEIPVSKTSYGSLVGSLGTSSNTIASIQAQLPALTSWKVNDGLPERNASYDDSKWTIANHTSTQNPTPPATYPVLYADDYGFHAGNLLYRGRFSGTTATGVFLAVVGGTSSGFSAYLNGAYIGSWLGSTSITNGTLSLSFSNATLSSTNVLFIIQDHMGHDETSGATNPRGIYNATLLGPTKSNLTFTSWKVAGTAGGESNIDPVRGPYNEGGLHAERLGWHLPNFPDSSWSSSTPEIGLSEAGAKFYRTVAKLDLSRELDVSLGFVLGSPAGTKVRAQLYVNGYMFGKFVPWIGNQVVFPVFPGILDYHGENTIALSIWAQDAAGGGVSVDWTVLGVVNSAFDPGFEAEDLRPGWSDRSSYY
ncbi:glycoside hydrolase family 35 protein [Hyaloscypha variabilis F]|uniref:beta-galactosidase n=1 Tax=Hyaloscypha variabilis (strain UAMH 11265 / GT02V1 / F) TaxID=1149755 RepID=A0A2J6RYD8_HYAVF|nr:glycoside hydrolase family 35 protein [Hyaloscypha variabilis F]